MPPINPEEDISPFEGFGQENAGGGYANAFADDGEDDEAFDYDAFIREYDHQTGAAPAPAPEPAAEEAAAPETDDSAAPPVPEPEQKPTSEPASAPAEKTHAYSPKVTGVLPDGPVNKGAWVNVVQETERSFDPLRGMLTGSTARIVGNALVVKLAKPLFLPDMLIKSKLLPVVEKNLHRTYDIRFE
jgi:hypothetical protein